jgi:hypothetical protein
MEDAMDLPVEHPEFEGWERLVGAWSIDVRHPLLPGDDIRGLTAFEWLADQHFLLQRTHYDHPEMPDAVTVTGIIDGQPEMHYFDQRGKHRTFAVSLDGDTWRYWNDDPSFAQRFTGELSSDNTAIIGRAERSEDGGATWELDLELTYRRLEPS